MSDADPCSRTDGDCDPPGNGTSIAPACVATYLGATEAELRGVRRFARLAAMSDQRRLFPHQGTIQLRQDTLLLQHWRAIPRERLASVELTFTTGYSRWMAGGIRGGRNASLGLFGSLGKPLVLRALDSDPVYLLIDFRWLSGINDARRWLPTISEWLANGRPHEVQDTKTPPASHGRG